MHNNILRHFHTFHKEKKKQRRLAAFLVTHVMVLDESIAQKIRDHFLRCTQPNPTPPGRVLLLKQKSPCASPTHLGRPEHLGLLESRNQGKGGPCVSASVNGLQTDAAQQVERSECDFSSFYFFLSKITPPKWQKKVEECARTSRYMLALLLTAISSQART
jgi:hypothetical protein